MPDESYRWFPRPIGLNWIPCFVCGHGQMQAQHDMSGFVSDRHEGARLVTLFQACGASDAGAKLDYRDYEPTRVQVKVGACDQHLPNLRLLRLLVLHNVEVVSVDIIRQCLPVSQQGISIHGRCPDTGTCHHQCPTVGDCYRVAHCGPLSGAYPNDQWPEELLSGTRIS